MRSDQPPDVADDLVRLVAAWAEAINCLCLLLCTSGRRWVMEMTAGERKKMLVSSSEAALAFATWNSRRATGSGDWKASEAAVLRLTKLLDEGELDDPAHFFRIEATIREATVSMGVPLPDYPLGVDGSVCRLHGATCPPAQEGSER